MDVRSYDPAIARFTGIDPVTHHSMSTYTAFDNNPVFWSDPSGANSTAEWMEANGITDDDLTTVYQSNSSDDNGYDQDGNQVNDNGGDETDYVYDKNGKVISSTSVEYKGPIQSSKPLRGYGYKGFRMAQGNATEDNTIANVFIGNAVLKPVFGAFSKGFSILYGKIAAKSSGRIFYVGEGAVTLARNIASQTGYKTIYNTWYGALGQRVTPFLSQSTSRRMWGYLSAKFANGAKYGDDIITVFGRHRSTGLHTIPINSKAAWKTVEFPILNSKGIPYRPILTH